MAIAQTVNGDLIVVGSITCTGTPPAATRTQLTAETSARYKIPPTFWRVWDAQDTNLPGTPATDDLGYVGGTFATAAQSVQTGDLKAAGATTRRARCSVSLPTEYVAGASCKIRAHAGMLTTIADTSATIDFEVYRSGDDTTIGSDICATAAQSINFTTFADIEFTITGTTLFPGDTLDIRMSITVTDAATLTVVKGCAGAVQLLLTVKG